MITDITEFMRSIDARYRAQSGLTERRLYSIFYSQILPSRVMILGFNPGGDPETWDESLLASPSYYEGGEHEYVDCNYPLAVAMRIFLQDALSLPSVAAIRRIPKSNLIFRRSSGHDSLSLPAGQAMDEALPFVEEMLCRVQPNFVILEGVVTLDKFIKRYCVGEVRQMRGVDISTPNGRHPACLFRAVQAGVRCLGRDATLIGLGHPSKYAGRAEWRAVVAQAKTLFGDVANVV